jgi:hypothetical protein
MAGVPRGWRGRRAGLRGRGRRVGSESIFATAARFTRTCSAMSTISCCIALAPTPLRFFPLTLPPPRALPLAPPRRASASRAPPAQSPKEPPAIPPHRSGATAGVGGPADFAGAGFRGWDGDGGPLGDSDGDSERGTPLGPLFRFSPPSTSCSIRLCSASSSLLRVSTHLPRRRGGNHPAAQLTVSSSVFDSCHGGLREM